MAAPVYSRATFSFLPGSWLFLCIVLAAVVRAADPVPPVNAIFVGQIFETPVNPALMEEPLSLPEYQQRGLEALKNENTRFIDLKVIVGESGYRCLSEGREWTWDVEPIAVFGKNVVGGNFTMKRSGQETMTTVQGSPGKMFFVRAVPGNNAKATEAGFVETAFANTAPPAVFSHIPRNFLNAARLVLDALEMRNGARFVGSGPIGNCFVLP